MTPKKISKKGQELVADLVESAKYHGWQEDQGCRDEPAKAAQQCEEDTNKVLAYVLKLENAIRRLKEAA